MHLVDFIKMVTISKGLAWIKDIKMKSIFEDFTCDLVILHTTKNFIKDHCYPFAIGLKKTLYVKT